MPETVDTSTASFRSSWTELEAAIKQDLESLADSAGGQTAELRKEFNITSSKLFRLDHCASQAAHSLPAFELWKHSTVSKQLRAELATLRAKKLPRQKFKFTDDSKIVVVEDPLAQGIRTLDSQATGVDDLSSWDVCDSIADAAQTTIKNLTGAERVVHIDQSRGQAWTLSDLKDCTIFLHGPIQALYLHRLERCHVEAGPVHSATFGEELHDCQLILASHQLRLHASSNLQVRVRAGSSPIIEGCSGIGFGPLLSLPYHGFEELCHAADLLVHDAHWEHVQDFLNPGSQVKKNWYVIASNG